MVCGEPDNKHSCFTAIEGFFEELSDYKILKNSLMHVVILAWFLTPVNFFFSYTSLGFTEHICNTFTELLL
jgi:hypothetical protein